MKTEYRIVFSGATPVETTVQIRIKKPATAAGIQRKISTFPAHMYRLSFAKRATRRICKDTSRASCHMAPGVRLSKMPSCFCASMGMSGTQMTRPMKVVHGFSATG
jgi:hypothetical protein